MIRTPKGHGWDTIRRLTGHFLDTNSSQVVFVFVIICYRRVGGNVVCSHCCIVACGPQNLGFELKNCSTLRI